MTARPSARCLRTGLVAVPAALTLLAATALAAVPAAASAAPVPTVTLVAPAQVALGDPVEVQVVLTGATRVAGYQAAVRVDGARASYAGLVPSTARLSAAGTGQQPLTPVPSASGVTFGAWSCSSSACLAADHDVAPGRQTLATVTVYPTADGALPVALGDVVLVDGSGRRVPARAGGTQVVRVGSGGTRAALPAAPVDRATDRGGLVRVPAALQVPRPTTATVGDLARDWSDVLGSGGACGAWVPADADATGDGCLDIADVQASAQRVVPTRPVTATPAATSSRAGVARTAGSSAAAAVVRPATAPSPTPGGTTAANTQTYVVTSNADTGGSCTAALCTLRAAMMAANSYGNSSNPGAALITFDIPGGGVQTIQLAAKLPTMTNPYGITFDARTQPGWTAPTDPNTFNGTDAIVIVGNGYETNATSTANFDGFFAQTPNNAWYGIDLYNVRKGIVFDSAKSVSNGVYDSIVCTDGAGSFKADHVVAIGAGIVIGNSASNNQIGYQGAAYRNVVSGCAAKGVVINGPASYNQVQNNILGLSPDTTKAVPNQSHGSDNNYGLTYNTIGGLQPGQGNLMSGNLGEGVEVSHNPNNKYNKVLGNRIGTDATGNAAPAYAANSEHGVSLEGAPECDDCKSDAGLTEVAGNIIVQNVLGGIIVDKGRHDDNIHDNRIGLTANGTAAPNGYFGISLEYETHNTMIGPNNIIAYNKVGVIVTPYPTRQDDTTDEGPTDDNTITRNSIFSSVGFGIDLYPIGKINTPANADIDVNDGMIAPTLGAVTSSSVTATTCASCVVELFVADTTQPFTYGSGITYIASATADANGTAVIQVPSADQGQPVTATATDPAGSTSEFSKNVTVPVTATNQPPTASATVSCTHLTCSFDGSASHDPEGKPLTYAWSFGDGATGSGATVSHTYAQPGTDTVSLTVTDDQGLTGTTGVTAMPVNSPPMAVASVTCTALTCAFDGSGSSDSDGTVASYSWDFGDGSALGSGPTPSHTYGAAGSYTATLTVTDDDGATAMTTVGATVSAPAAVTVGSDAFGRTVKSGWGTADVGGAYGYSANAKGLLSVAGGTGSIRLANGTLRYASLPVSELTTDATATVSVDTAAAAGNGQQAGLQVRKQAADVEYRGVVRVSGGTVYADVLRDSPSGNVLLGEAAVPALSAAPGTAYRVHVAVSGTSPTALSLTVYDPAGSVPAPQVQVTDSDAALQQAGGIAVEASSSTAAKTTPVVFGVDDLLVTAPEAPPTASFTATCNVRKCTFDGTGSRASGGSVSSYAWTFGDGASATTAAPKHTYKKAGTYTVTLTVTSGQGTASSTSMAVSTT